MPLETLPRFAQQHPVFLMGIVADIDLFLQGAERTFSTAVADVGRIEMPGTDILLEVRASEIADAAPVAKPESLR